ncbi:tetratricopeptide repeat protein [Actinotignum urinale]|uniref:Tetratricopeptide repeat protein n=2 Tax=Actinotignum TaxID=1653174 RepID=A0AAW9HMY1_9ACTO|nr:tetratricopeptide repeat protein [Actinotignum urinale]MDY5129453.1 tetratricopeptide repeat protein [Actinotignum urinale]MDY5151620.1 tetratricopeptide repeat protein [Actinotignum urinale]MDY5155268.1 tetratricopeptide repeat protein [Actinotignum urinale]MDY5161025.1 tetratricopeptide repeat protein [Actinotignum urinale]WIK59376.1 tetratricopeptide repeat protein [Actinotignum urinale]
MSLYGAVDLGARKAAQEQEKAAAIPGKYVRTLNVQGLQEVAGLSEQVPVIVLFTGDGLAGEVGALLENESKNRDGRFQVAVVNAQTEVQLVQAFGVQAVPTALAVIKGQPVPLFQGVPDTKAISQVIDQLLEAAKGAGVAGRISGNEEEAGAPLRNEHEVAALKAMDAGDMKLAHAEFTKLLDEEPGNEAGIVGLAQISLLERVEGTSPEEVLAKADSAGIQDVDAQLLAADTEVAGGRPDLAFQRLIHVISVSGGEEKEKARVHLLELFNAVGASTDLVKDARKKLAMALF